jgi:hypothetical protein
MCNNGDDIMAYRESARSELRRLMREERKREEAVQRRRERAIPIRDDRDISIGYAVEDVNEGENVAVRLDNNGIAGLLADGDIVAGNLVNASSGGYVHYAGDNANFARAPETIHNGTMHINDVQPINIENIQINANWVPEGDNRSFEEIQDELIRAAEAHNLFLAGHSPRSREVVWEEPKDKVVMKWQKEIKMRWD